MDGRFRFGGWRIYCVFMYDLGSCVVERYLFDYYFNGVGGEVFVGLVGFCD